MTQVQVDCEQGLLRVIRAMEAALKEASGENAPPLPSSLRRSTTTFSQNNNQNFSSVLHDASSSSAAATTSDTTIVKREKWEQKMKDKLAPLAAEVQDACASLHQSLGNLNEFCLDEERAKEARKRMVIETAILEERIVDVYAQAARQEDELMKDLEKWALKKQ